MSRFLPAWAGAAGLGAVLLGLAGTTRFIATGSMAGPLARILDVAAPGLSMLALVLAGLTWWLGLRVLGVVLALAIMGNMGELGWRHVSHSIASRPELDPNLRILFFNVRINNDRRADRIVEAALAAEPDLIVFAEASSVLPARAALEAEYEFVSHCPETACELLVAARRAPLRFWRLTLNPVWPPRYAVMEFAPEAFLAAAHLTKPWFSGVSEPELTQLIAQLNWLPETAIVVGDFNAPPWSRPMRELLANTDFAAPRWPPGTWPAGARPRLPIDMILLRGEAEIVSITPFGDGLRSNHLGFLAEISLPGLEY